MSTNRKMMKPLNEFPISVYRQRLSRARKLMEDLDLDGIVITGEENVFYFSGVRIFRPWITFPRPDFVILPREGSAVMCVNESHATHASLASWITDIRSYPELTGPPPELVVKAISDAGLLKGKIGAELGYEQRINIPVETFRKIEEGIGQRFLDASRLIWRMRMIKDPEEIDCIRRACQILSLAYEESFEAVIPGMTEHEFATLIRTSICRHGAEGPAFLVMNSAADSESSKEGESLPHVLALMSRQPDGRLLRGNEVVWIDSGAVYKGYNSDFSRVKSLGKPTERQIKNYNLVKRLTHACVGKMNPGVLCSDVNKFCNRWLKSEGLDIAFEHGRIGHGLGLLLTEPPHIGLYDNTVIEQNMVLAIEPGIITDFGAFHVEENVLIREDGPEILSLTSESLKTGF